MLLIDPAELARLKRDRDAYRMGYYLLGILWLVFLFL